jgi:hypothetical protein
MSVTPALRVALAGLVVGATVTDPVTKAVKSIVREVGRGLGLVKKPRRHSHRRRR